MNCSNVMDRTVGVLVVLLLWYLTLAPNKSVFCNGNPNMICREEERKALLSFKQGLSDPFNPLSSWTGLDCCTWKGVGCDNITGRVVQLNLASLSLGGELRDSLLHLKHLRYLDVSSNYFPGVPIPKFIGSLTNLRYLDLSDAYFSGVIPQDLGNLSRLHHLDVQSYYLSVEDLGWISHLPSLKFLDMSGVNLSKALNWLQVMNTLPSLSELHLSACGIDNLAPLPYVNFSSLSALDLSSNNISDSKFEWFTSLGSLVELDLSYNSFHGPIPVTLQNMTTLQFLNLSGNNFNSALPEWLYGLTSLESLCLPSNNFQGKLSLAIGNLTSLTELDLSNNGLQGEIPGSLGDLRNLQVLYVSYNQLNGTIPESIGHLSELEELYLSHNQLHGNVPKTFGGLWKVEELYLSHNFLKGVLYEAHFANLTKLRLFSVSSSMLTLQVSSDWIPPFQLENIGMQSLQLGPRFPSWLRTQKYCQSLDLSNAKITDVIPTWFWSFSQVYYLNLSHNLMHGNIPSLPFGRSIYLGSNNFSGQLPQISSSIFDLDLSKNSFNGSLSHMLGERLDEEKMLNFLDLSSNLLSGELPDCWMNWPQLTVLKLGNNNLSGKIPESMGSLLKLVSLNLRDNSLSGKLPPSLQNCRMLMGLDLSKNEFTGSIPTWIGKSMVDLKVLALRSNKLSGRIPQELCNLNSLQIFDLANNSLSGSIPQCFSNFSAMTKQQNSSGLISYLIFGRVVVETTSLIMKRMEYEYGSTLALVTNIDLSCNTLTGEIPEEVTSLYGLLFLNLSKNHLQGKIPEKINNMKSLESLDLSMNRLSGLIPQSMAELSFLAHLNLSYNNFSGKIPSGTQLQSFSPLSFIGNNGLYGPPLTDHCIGSDAQHQIPKAGDDEKHGGHGWIDMKWFYMSIPFGFVVGFWGVCGPLAFNKAWRYAYFRFLDDMEYKLWGLFHKCK